MAFRVAIIGCGSIAQVHANVLTQLDSTQIVACVDIKPEKAQAMAQKFGCHCYTDIETMLKQEEIDAVHICTPHFTHLPIAEIAAQYGKAVFCEKPPAITKEQWVRFKAVGDKVPVGICFQNRFNPNVERAHELIESGQMGKLLGVRAFITWRRDAAYYSDDWHGRWDTEGGGCLINQCIHTLDLMLGFLGKPDVVEATMANHHLRGVTEVEDTVEIYLENSGKRGLLYGSCAYIADEPVYLELRCEKGTVAIHEEMLSIHCNDEYMQEHCPQDTVLGKSYWGAGHFRCIADFYEALKEGRPCRNSLPSCETTVMTMLSAYEQCKENVEQQACKRT